MMFEVSDFNVICVECSFQRVTKLKLWSAISSRRYRMICNKSYALRSSSERNSA